MKINNEIYDEMANHWWNESEFGTMATILYHSNIARFCYFTSILESKFNFDYPKECLIDIGCGGGYLSEDFAKIGMNVTGIDPSKESIKAAEKHARENNLNINYVHGYGENLPFESNSFSFATCCDVIEHVKDVNAVISEISRVLKPGGILFFDTINRTIISKIMLEVTQNWKSTSFMEQNIHVWDMFIKPKELFKIFKSQGLKNIEIKGISPKLNMFSTYLYLRQCKRKEISIKELAKLLDIQISNNTQELYIGYAIKESSR
ncbi:MAG: bifunctional 2-polyprenyl-6-hydroxyphenol methylase/3-demethylubiquinol 3-O-methyltransferase UbiG [Desulfobulbus sp.]|nr:bifunctional 2-polyprenyl-6-hydroxyphenol methylase/3-demethylubiquinol 3-O-methyltransferase UbiG [Desulfobulbus sp.]